ncbi:MAG: hypothetical protein HY717_10575 [Planctomycetes bacterium]|nr:hypothetical protein [Planctomycetota bacterium]
MPRLGAPGVRRIPGVEGFNSLEGNAVTPPGRHKLLQICFHPALTTALLDLGRIDRSSGDEGAFAAVGPRGFFQSLVDHLAEVPGAPLREALVEGAEVAASEDRDVGDAGDAAEVPVAVEVVKQHLEQPVLLRRRQPPATR